MKLYRWPATRFVTNTPWQQWRHMFSELLEIGWELLKDDFQRASQESWDLDQSGETFRRILAGQGVDLETAREQVEWGCIDRGYYLNDSRESNERKTDAGGLATSPFSGQVGGTHYLDMPIQPTEFVLKNRLGFAEGNVIKYLCRHDKKGGKADLLKARHYLDMIIMEVYP